MDQKTLPEVEQPPLPPPPPPPPPTSADISIIIKDKEGITKGKMGRALHQLLNWPSTVDQKQEALHQIPQKPLLKDPDLLPSADEVKSHKRNELLQSSGSRWNSPRTVQDTWYLSFQGIPSLPRCHRCYTLQEQRTQIRVRELQRQFPAFHCLKNPGPHLPQQANHKRLWEQCA